MSDIDSRLEAALRSIFFPLARVLLRNGLSVRPVIRVIKDAFVDAAIAEHGRNGKPASISRASEVTGLTRREIRTIINEELDKKVRLNLFQPDEAAVLTRWHSSPEFADEHGNPRKLEPGPGPGSFAELVEQTIGEVSVADSLGRLKDRGSVEVDDDGRIVMLKRDWHVGGDLPVLLRDTLGTLASTINYNNTHPPEQGRCQRVAYTMKADPQKLLVIRRMLRERIIRFTEEIDDQLTSVEAPTAYAPADIAESDSGKLGVGAYLFEIEPPEHMGD